METEKETQMLKVITDDDVNCKYTQEHITFRAEEKRRTR